MGSQDVNRCALSSAMCSMERKVDHVTLPAQGSGRKTVSTGLSVRNANCEWHRKGADVAACNTALRKDQANVFACILRYANGPDQPWQKGSGNVLLLYFRKARHLRCPGCLVGLLAAKQRDACTASCLHCSQRRARVPSGVLE